MSEIGDILAIGGKRPYSGSYSLANSDQFGTKETPYLPAPELTKVVNLALFLEKRPLLLKGEPGSGKTRLASAIAKDRGLNS